MKLKGKGEKATLELTSEELDKIIEALTERYEHSADDDGGLVEALQELKSHSAGEEVGAA